MKLKSLFGVSLFLMIFSMFLNAENPPSIEHITSNNGLSHNTIRCMLQDKTGFIWFGSLNGLNRYDGVKIKTFKPETLNPASLTSGKIKELHLDSFGHIWIRTYGDIMHCYDPNIENFIQLYANKTDQLTKHNSYYEDKNHNIWLGSVNAGCVKVTFENGKVKTRVYNTSSSDSKLPSDNVNDIFEDSSDNIWILTDNGIALINDDKKSSAVKNIEPGQNFLKAWELNKKIYLISNRGIIKTYNLTTNNFLPNKIIPATATAFQSICLGENEILISTVNKGVYTYNINTGKFESFETEFAEKISGNAYFQHDSFGNVWMYNFTGNVWMINKKTRKIVRLNLIPPTVLQLIDEERYQFQSDKHGNDWITTYGNGLFCYNTNIGNLSHYTYNKNSNGLASNYLLSIVLDKNENIWVGTESMGVNKLSFANRNVQILYPDPENTLRSGNNVKAFLELQNGNIWVSTKAGNLYQYDSTLTVKKALFQNTYNVYSMFQEPGGTIWLTTKLNGIIELKNGNINDRIIYKKSDIPGSLSYNTVFSAMKDSKGRLWVATFGGGLCVKTDSKSPDGFRTFFNEDNWVKYTRYVFQDKKGDLWVGTNNGVLRFNPDTLLLNANKYKYYTFNADYSDCLSNPEVRFIFQDSKNNIWLATSGGGLNEFIGETSDGNGRFKVYNNQHGMANDNIMSIQEDKSNNLWISTESGLHKLNPKNGLFQYYKFSDDFSSNIFSETACLTCRDGKMLFGSMNGFYAFYPESLTINKNEVNKVVLTGFYIYDQEAKIGSRNAPLSQSVTFSKKVVLKAVDKVFHIEFTNLNFRDPKANQYMYILENFEKRWNLSGSFDIATYRNVPPGKYTFKVKSVNSEGLWDDNITTLEIEILPPFWQSNLAFIIYFIILVGLLYIAFKLILKFYNLNNEVKIERQLTDYKLRFFTNISHEFRTPLTLIKGSVDTLTDLRDKMTAPLQNLVNDLDKNTTHLMRLIDQLMEFRKLQNNKQKLNLQRTEVVSFLQDIFNSFENVAKKSNIEYKFLHSQATIPIYIDQNKLDKIIFNLLSNAFKFTPRGGKISLNVEISESTQMLRISVTDNGIGIPKDKQNLLFSRFMQINFSASGTGVGLSLVNEFTTLHKGNVKFRENDGGGSVFIVELPLNNAVYNKEDFLNEQVTIAQNDKKEVYELSDFFDYNNSETLINLLPNAPNAGKKYKILVIDDNDDIRDFLTEKLSPYFEIITADEGNAGIKASMNEDPDLIICDVMMPGMNGFDLTKKLKDDFSTCHIPVILLTAYVSDEHHTEGIMAGADAYISKPFSLTHLMLQINKLIEKRELIHKHYASNETSDVPKTETTLEIPDRDNQFLELIEEILEQNLTNPEFSVDEFAQLTNTGRTLFFKKLKYLTGYTPNDFIRVRRMKKAAELLKTYKYNVSEVSYMVGINDPFYFSKCFKTQFGCSPSKYLNSL